MKKTFIITTLALASLTVVGAQASAPKLYVNPETFQNELNQLDALLIGGSLTPEQQKKWDEWLTKHRPYSSMKIDYMREKFNRVTGTPAATPAATRAAATPAARTAAAAPARPAATAAALPLGGLTADLMKQHIGDFMKYLAQFDAAEKAKLKRAFNDLENANKVFATQLEEFIESATVINARQKNTLADKVIALIALAQATIKAVTPILTYEDKYGLAETIEKQLATFKKTYIENESTPSKKIPGSIIVAFNALQAWFASMQNSEVNNKFQALENAIENKTPVKEGQSTTYKDRYETPQAHEKAVAQAVDELFTALLKKLEVPQQETLVQSLTELCNTGLQAAQELTKIAREALGLAKQNKFVETLVTEEAASALDPKHSAEEMSLGFFDE